MVLTAITATCGCLLLVDIAILFPVVAQTHHTRLGLLSCFLCLPVPVIASLGKKCEDFMATLQDSRDDNDVSPFEDRMSTGELERLEQSGTYVGPKNIA